MQKRIYCGMILVVLLAGCTGLPAPKVENTHLYLLDARPAITTPRKNELVLAVSMPDARSGYDTPQMAYLRQPLELEYFATHRWADTPARMLKPLLIQALEPVFQNVIPAPGMLPANLRLDTELIRLHQDFTTKPGRIQLTLRAQLIDMQDKHVIAVKLFDESEQTASDDAYSGVGAANRVLQRVLDQLTVFCQNESGHEVK